MLLIMKQGKVGARPFHDIEEQTMLKKIILFTAFAASISVMSSETMAAAAGDARDVLKALRLKMTWNSISVRTPENTPNTPAYAALAQEGMHLLTTGKTIDGTKDFGITDKRNFYVGEQDLYNAFIALAAQSTTPIDWAPIAAATAPGPLEQAHAAKVKADYESLRPKAPAPAKTAFTAPSSPVSDASPASSGASSPRPHLSAKEKAEALKTMLERLEKAGTPASGHTSGDDGDDDGDWDK